MIYFALYIKKIYIKNIIMKIYYLKKKNKKKFFFKMSNK